MDQNIEVEDILNAYITKHGTHPHKTQQSITFSKQWRKLNNLKYSRVRKILNHSKSKQSSTCHKINTNKNSGSNEHETSALQHAKNKEKNFGAASCESCSKSASRKNKKSSNTNNNSNHTNVCRSNK